MARDLIAGISIAEGCANLALLELREEGHHLLHLQEYAETSKDEHWFLEPLLNPQNKWLKKVTRAAIGLDTASLLLHTFPLDTTLSQTDQNTHVHWELGNFIIGYQAKDFISDVHILRTDSRDQVAQALVVAARRAVVFGIQGVLAARRIELELADTSFFGAEYALLASESDVRNHTVAIVSVMPHRVDLGILEGGRLTAYGYTQSAAAEAILRLLREQRPGTPLAGVYCCGPAISPELTEALVDSVAGKKVVLLNPFRNGIRTSTFSGFDVYTGLEHRFAAAIGVALKAGVQ